MFENKNPCKLFNCRDFGRVPGRTRTVDIQNHKHFYGLFGNPFVHRGFRRLEKTRLRLFCGYSS